MSILPKRVSFAHPVATSSSSVSTADNTSSSSSSSVHVDDLSDSLLGNSFTSSTFPHDSPSSSSRAVPLLNMSLDRLRDSDAHQKYSSVSTSDDDDGPPPLEEIPSSDRRDSSSSGGGHSECDHLSHKRGDSHAHSHGGRHINAKNGSGGVTPTSDSPTSPRTPNGTGSAENCGGLKNKKKGEMAAEANKHARRQLAWAAAFCFVFMICEVVGGLVANSLAILTDAAHLLSDLAGFLISIFALWLATRPATSRLSFGFHRAEILGALISVILIWLLTGILLYEACWRLAHPEVVNGKLMFIVAAAGLVVNAGMGMILMQKGVPHSHGLPGEECHGHSHGGTSPASKNNNEGDEDHGHSHGGGSCNGGDDHGHSHAVVSSHDDHGHSHGSGDDDHGHSHSGSSSRRDSESSEPEHAEPENLNVKAAFIHVLGDAIQTVGVMIAAGLIWYNPDWNVADPLCTFLFSILVLFTTTRLIKQSVGVLMEGVPDGISPDEVEAALLEVPGVIAVHDLHIWSLSVGKPSLSVHLYCRDDAAHVLAAANKMCAARFNIHHSTIQVEKQHDDVACNDAFIAGNANLDRITQDNFSQLGMGPASV